MKKLIFILSAITFFIACNDNKTGGIMGGGWSASDKEKWMNDCTPGLVSSMSEDVAKKYCNCVLEQLEKKYSNYKEMNRKGSYEEGQALGKNCTYIITGGQQGGGNDNTNDGGGGLMGGWSSTDEQKFMSTCIQNAVNTGADEQTSRTHCNCTLKKIQKKYNSYDEADRSMTQSEVAALEQECLDERGSLNNN